MDQATKDQILKAREFKTRACVADWFKELLDAGLNFHPEDSGDFIDTETRKPTFTRAERVLYEALMDNAWHCCSKYEPAIDPSEIACNVFNQWLADNGLLNDSEKTVAAAARLKIAQLNERNPEIAAFIAKHGALAILQTMSEVLPVASDESRSNGPRALTDGEVFDNWLADQCAGLVKESERMLSM